jgi:tetratricopeptide (TPR) repeat protein
MASSVQDQVFAPEVHLTKEPPEDCDMTIEETPEDCDMMTEEPSHLESPKDVPNRLSHDLSPDSRYADLFAELDIEIAMESTKLGNQEEDIGEEPFISKSEFHNLSRSDGHKSTFMEIYSVEPSDHSQLDPSEIFSVRRIYHTAQYRSAWSPLFEIDIFPVGGGVNRGTWKCAGSFRKSLRKEYKERKDQLLKLQQILPISSPGIISILERLTSIAHDWIFFDLTPFEQLLKARLNEKTPSIYKLVEASLRLISHCVDRNSIHRVAQFHKELHSRIRKGLPEDNPLHLQSSYSMAYTLYLQKRIDEAETMIRPVIRICLSNLGPYHNFSIRVLLLLGRIIQHQNSEHLEEAHRLLRLNTDILEQRALGRVWWQSSNDLLRLLVKREHYSESISLSQHIETCVEANFGMEDYLIARSRANCARVLRKQGKISAVIDFLRETVREYKFTKETHVAPFLYFEMARCCEDINDFRRALELHQIILKRYALSSDKEWTDSSVIGVCSDIGYCYKKLGKYHVAASFYGRVLGKLHTYKKNPWTQKCIRRVRRWLVVARRELAREKHAGNEKNSAENSKVLKEPVAEKYESNDEGDTVVIEHDGGVNENKDEDWDEDWEEIFGRKVQDREVSAESLGLSEAFLKLDISQS